VVRLGMECYRLTYSLGSMLAQNCHKKTAQKAGSCVDRACRCRRCFNMRQTLCVQGAGESALRSADKLVSGSI